MRAPVAEAERRLGGPKVASKAANLSSKIALTPGAGVHRAVAFVENRVQFLTRKEILSMINRSSTSTRFAMARTICGVADAARGSDEKYAEIALTIVSAPSAIRSTARQSSVSFTGFKNYEMS